MSTLKQTVFTVLTILVILSVSAVIIAYGRGYRFDTEKKEIGSTGLISLTSDPTGAIITIDGKKVGATNTTVTIKPGWYTVTITKEGYQPWEKNMKVQGEVVASAHAVLFPTNPSLSAITTSGVTAPALSPDGGKLAFIIPQDISATAGADIADRAGIWVLDLVDKPLTLNRDAKQVIKSTALSTNEASLSWSPDGKQLLVEYPKSTISYLLEADTLNAYAKPMYDKKTLTATWELQTKTKEQEKLQTLSPDLVQVATTSMHIISFSPDEQKFLYEATASATIPQIITPALLGTNPTEETRIIAPKTLYVYDIKEDKNYKLGQTSPFPILWLPSNRQLLSAGNNTINVIDYDGTNQKTVYAGPFWDSFVAPWTNASKLVILTNLNPSASTLPNLYAVNIK